MPGIIPDTEIVYVFAVFGFSFEKSVGEAKPHLNTSYSRFSKKTFLKPMLQILKLSFIA